MDFAQLSAEALARAGVTACDDEQQQLFGLAEFLVRMAQREPVEMQEWLDAQAYSRPLTPELIRQDIALLALEFPLADAKRSDLARLQRALRELRYRTQRTVIWRHLSRRADLLETTQALSALADGLLEVTLRWCEAAIAGIEGAARSDGGQDPGGDPGSDQDKEVHLVVYALGKLGGRELNLSSDIDLICAYSESGKTSKTGKTNQQFFVLVVQLLVKALGETTGDGFGFRVDLRLRPYGDSGPVVQSFAAMERYFESNGRDWERYALIKARACAGDIIAGNGLLERLRPFVYRRYLDFSAIDSMREMRAQIRRDHGVHADNVKLGAGGIRDIEFLVQMLQLIWGGRVTPLRTNSLRAAMDALVQENLLTTADRQTLWSAYEFFRDIEHALQAFRDEQTHTLPTTTEDKLRLAKALQIEGYAELEARLREQQAKVLGCISHWLDEDDAPAPNSREQPLPSDLQEQVPGRSAQVLIELRAAADRAPEALVPERLDRLLPLLVEDLLAGLQADESAPPLDVVLLRLEVLLINVLRRSAYLVLLSENSNVRQELVSLALAGDYFTSLLARHPALLEELFLRISLAAVPDQAALRSELAVLLPEIVGSELQQQHFDRLAQYKSQHQFRCLLALSRGDLTVMQMADYLTRLAESVVEVVLRWAWQSLDPRAVGTQPNALPEGFLVIGYGKLGGCELGAGSDLDLVFLHNRESSEQGMLHQLTRRVLNYLAMQTYFGPLYEVDIRLRPAGRDGTMVSSVAGFTTYQQNSAWLWEHQALLRARPVAGCAALAAEFLNVRRSILATTRDRDATRREIVQMRERMRGSIPVTTAALEIKQAPGGIVDIEFMVQYLALGWAAEFPSLLDFPDNARILELAAAKGLLESEVARQLIADYAQLRHVGQLLIVSSARFPTRTDSLGRARERVAALWQRLMILQL